MTAAALFALPPGVAFAAEFARGWHRRHSGLSPAGMAAATIFVGTAGAARGIERALADEAPAPGPLPRIRLIQELADDPVLDLPPAIAPLRRQLHLTRLVERFIRARREAGEPAAPVAAAADLAEALAFHLDQFHDHGVSMETLDGAVAAGELSEGAARHWQESLAFFDIVRTAWPVIRAEEEDGAMDPRARQALAIERQVTLWRKAPPEFPIVVAGSTGSVGTTARLMAAVAELPRGAVVLPGFDPATEKSVWDHVEADHPLGPFRNLLATLDMRPADVQPWQPETERARREVIAQAMRPAPVTDHWRAAADDVAAAAPEALAGIKIIEAAGERAEAGAIAMAIREAIEDPDRRVALITPDGALARRVTAELDRFGVVPDDTVGAPLALSVPGVLMRLALAAAGPEATTLDLAALLQHPLVRPGRSRAQHLTLARRYERTVLRGHVGDIPVLPEIQECERNKTIRDWRDAVDAALAPLRTVLRDGANLRDGVTALDRTLETLTDPGDGEPAIWVGDGGDDLRRFLAEVATAADALGGGPVADLPATLNSLMRGRQLRPKPRAVHPRVRITGPREARTEDADLVVLAGLNDGVWPAAADPGPWLSRPMHAALGLPPPERATGLSAHDFLMAACRPDAILTRSTRIEGAPTVASRWLVRLETLLEGVGSGGVWQEAVARGAHYLSIAEKIDRPARAEPRAERPRPSIVPEAMPARLPATQLETLLRDAYAVYARYVLGLRPVDPLGCRPDVRERGKLLHRVLETFVEQSDPWPGAEAARAVLAESADAALHEQSLPSDLRRAWRARIERFATWLVESENVRRRTATPFAREREGSMTLALGARTMTLTARADRIDKHHDGRGLLYDYKSGKPPSKKQIELRFNQQLHLAAAILREGGFPGAPSMPVGTGAYIGLTGGASGGEETECPTLGEDIDQYLDQLGELLRAYLAGAPWVSRGRPELLSYASDYDHLARLQEWAEDEDA